MSESGTTAGQAAGRSEVTAAMCAAADAAGVPDFLLPWLDRFYDREDIELVIAAARGSLGATEPERLDRAVRRAVLDAAEEGSYKPSSFHERLEIWAMFEGWKDVPSAVHRQLAAWDVDFYAERIRRDVESVSQGQPTDSYESRYTYILLEEAESILAAQQRIYLWPCDCRSIVSACRKPVDVCLRFENDRGLGWEISHERAVAIVKRADRAGLMHTADLRNDPADSRSICNCCTECCYPHLASAQLGTSDVWPIRRHVAQIDMDLCRKCGRCGLRCPFDAIVCRQDGMPELDPASCRGCGLCATGCSPEAITLLPLATR